MGTTSALGDVVDLYSIYPDGSHMERIVEEDGREANPFSTDEGHLFFTADWEGVWELYWRRPGG